MTATHPIAPLRDRLKVILEAVSGIGRVYDYMRHPVTDAEVKSLFVTTTSPRLHYWCITLGPDAKFLEERYPASHSRATVTFAIRGYYSLVDADATEKTFINLVEDVLDALRTHKGALNVDVIGGPWLTQGPAQWAGPNHVEVAGVLCHHAELVVPIRVAVEC